MPFICDLHLVNFVNRKKLPNSGIWKKIRVVIKKKKCKCIAHAHTCSVKNLKIINICVFLFLLYPLL